MVKRADWPWGDLRMFGYSVIVADPPYKFDLYKQSSGCHKGAAHHYAVMEMGDIKALRVRDLARGDCLLFLWMPTCMIIPYGGEILSAWGFAYKSEIVWRKVTRNGRARMGTGYRVRSMHESILLATVGNPKHAALHSLFDGLHRGHSRKPDEFYAMVERCVPLRFGARADLFARSPRPGWETWGDEREKFT